MMVLIWSSVFPSSILPPLISSQYKYLHSNTQTPCFFQNWHFFQKISPFDYFQIFQYSKINRGTLLYLSTPTIWNMDRKGYTSKRVHVYYSKKRKEPIKMHNVPIYVNKVFYMKHAFNAARTKFHVCKHSMFVDLFVRLLASKRELVRERTDWLATRWVSDCISFCCCFCYLHSACCNVSAVLRFGKKKKQRSLTLLATDFDMLPMRESENQTFHSVTLMYSIQDNNSSRFKIEKPFQSRTISKYIRNTSTRYKHW